MAQRRRSSTRANADVLPPYTPQLATLVTSAPDDDTWLHEVKYDGFRIGLRIDGDDVRLLTRNGLDWTARFPSIVAAASALATRAALIDGEMAFLLPDGRTRFQGLQNAGDDDGVLVYFAFDLLALNGRDVRTQPLETRKALLREILPATDAPIRYAGHVVGHGRRVHADACRAGLEGIISKKRDAPWTGGRSRDWLKAKCVARQEFVIGGYTEPQGTREGVGALLIGYYEGERLVWAGKVGTGFTAAAARDLRSRLDALARDTCPFDPVPRGAAVRSARWVTPALVAEVAFTEWTDGGKIRHPSFQGLRSDKPAAQVVRERPSAPVTSSHRAIPAERHRGGGTTTTRRAASKGTTGAEVAGVTITNAHRVMYPDPPVTKLDLARYYERVADWMLPHIAHRPLSLVFCPRGITGPCTYLKHGKSGRLTALRRVRIREKTKIDEYMVLDSVEGLVSLMQMNWIEAHTWSSRLTHLETPDRIVIDLDPGPAVDWPRVVHAARAARDALAARGLQAWVKTTGGRGLHLVAPLEPAASWDRCLAFAHVVAEDLVRDAPSIFTTDFAKAGREDSILVDMLRNRRGNTAVSAFSPRARPGAPVSTPIHWDELTARRRPDGFTVHSVPRRLARLGADPWAEYWTCRQQLPELSRT
jgi:bifunctional non-homologous end joining protein LigD